MNERPPSGSPRVLRYLNRNHVLRVMREHGPIGRADIARVTKLSRPTVNDVVADLMDAGLAAESLDGSEHKRPGPRAHLVRFRAEAGAVLGLDIGTTKVVAHLADLDGKVLATERKGAAGVRSRASLLRIVRQCIDALTETAGLPLSSLRAVGVATPGVVDPSTGAVSLAPQLPEWDGIVLAEELDPRLDAPVQVANEVHLAVLGERWLGAAHDLSHAVYIQIGVGIGLGILIDGQLYRGSEGAAGEIGYLPLVEPSSAAPPGVGVLEYAASGMAFARRGQAAAREAGGERLRELAGGDPGKVDAAAVLAAVREGDPAAQRITSELIELLARAAASVCLVLNPATVIVGGGLSQAGAVLVDPLERRMRELVPRPPRVETSRLGDEAGAYGALRLALDMSDSHIYAIPQSND